MFGMGIVELSVLVLFFVLPVVASWPWRLPGLDEAHRAASMDESRPGPAPAGRSRAALSFAAALAAMPGGPALPGATARRRRCRSCRR